MKGLIWCFNGLTNPNNIDKSAGDSLNSIYNEIETSKPIIIDCKGISGITDHAWDLLFKSVHTHKREVHFLNSQKIEQQITSSKKEFCSPLKMSVEESCIVLYASGKCLTVDDAIINEIAESIISRISKAISNCFFKYPNGQMKLLTSTPIYTTGEFDSAKIISHPESFFWACLKMADEVESIIQEFRLGGKSVAPKLLAVSLRACPFAAAIGMLIGLQIEAVDHFGPIINIQETDTTLAENCEYIYIGDFTIGGTEIKISKIYALMKDARLNHAVVLASLLTADAYREFTLHRLVALKDCTDVKYTLEPLKRT